MYSKIKNKKRRILLKPERTKHMKNIMEYVNDLCRFYKKWWKLILKMMVVCAAIEAGIIAIYMYGDKIHQFLVRSQEKLGDLIFGKPEIMEDAGGLAPEIEEGDDDNSVIASF